MTAKEFLEQSKNAFTYEDMIDFAKYHVEQALLNAGEVLECYPSERQEILNSYPLENIK